MHISLRGGTLRFPPLKLPTLKGLPVTVAGHWVLPLSYCACAPGASAVGTLSGRSRLIARPPLILATFVASALLAWKCSQSTFACGLRARRQPPRTRVLNMPQRASKRKTQRMLLHLGFAKLFSKASIKPRQRSGATVHFLCRSSNGCALRLAWAVFPRRNRLLLVLRSSSQLLLHRLCSHVNARKVHSHADCALAPSRCSHPCVERSTEGINQYREQSQRKKIR